MTYAVTITSQGQISLPAKIRKKLGFSRTNKALVSIEDGKVLIEPVKDLLELRGSLKTSIKVNPKKIRVGFEDYLAEEGIKSAK
ncbi:hypothetical protein A3I48_00750 [Candidatus Daviesbacteria bacterium RIFCSPLOWO2_02_FULL_36_7]|uniref:SpoVT-AbrB domain-containing protein n=1 Tax=Candidatus Daviesbacteria bacterium RIFCSPLOWO2_02_FULL_36_7 TaxID=1797792 RepID=A0A1F5MHS6_9BACT|nr:MAG: hypothetical protein A3I48_00750 [Candidatus Daviesbacteria bacterium RIFCSPLOWO2_02_FULL_36_7]